MKRSHIIRMILSLILCLSMLSSALADVLKLPEGIKVIDDEAFYGDESLDEVTLPEGVEVIGERAFAGSSLKKINLPASLEEIADSALDHDRQIEVTAQKGTKAYEWAKENSFITEDPSGADAESFTYTVNSDGTCTVTGYKYEPAGDLIIPAKSPDGLRVTAIGSRAFAYCTGFTGRLSLPVGIKEIGDYAFRECTGLTGELTIPESVTEIGKYAFYNCYRLTGDLKIPDSIRNIWGNAFRNCYGLNGKLTISKNMTRISECTFYNCRGLSGELVIPDNITRIDDAAFYSCKGFTGDLIIPDSVLLVESQAFQYCSGFNGTLQLPQHITTIEFRTFDGCTGFKGDLIIPFGVTEIGSCAFTDCKGFNGNLFISDTVISIGTEAFQSCSGLKGDLKIPDSITSIGGSAFSGCSGFDGSLVISSNLEKIGFYVFGHCTGLSGSLIIPDSVTIIGYGAFAGCTGFSGNLFIPDSVKTIDNNAFYECGGFDGILLLSENLTTIGESAFECCTGFTGGLTIPGSVTTIKNGAFAGCQGFDGVLLIKNGDADIHWRAFEGSGFQAVYCTENSKVWNDLLSFGDKRRPWDGISDPNSNPDIFVITGSVTCTENEEISGVKGVSIRGTSTVNPNDVRTAQTGSDGSWAITVKDKTTVYTIEYSHPQYIISGNGSNARAGQRLTATAIPKVQFITFSEGSDFIGKDEEVTSTKENGDIISRTNYPLVEGTQLNIPFRTSSDATKVTVKLRYWNEGYQNWYTYMVDEVETSASTTEFQENENGKSGVLKLTLPSKANIPEGDYVLQMWSKNGENKTVDARVKIRIVYAKIEGTITTVSGTPVPGVLIRATSVENSEDIGSTYSAADGTWSIGVEKDKLYTVDYQHSLFMINSTQNVKAGDKVTELAVAREFDIKYNNATIINKYRYASAGTKQFSVECDGEIESIEVYIDNVFVQSQYADNTVSFALTEGIHTITFRIDNFSFTTHFAVFTSISQTEMTVMDDNVTLYSWPAQGYESAIPLAKESKVQVRGTVADTYYYVLANGTEGFIKVDYATATEFTAPEGFAFQNAESQIRAGSIVSFVIQYSEKTRYIRLRYDNNTTIFENDYWKAKSAPATIPDHDVSQIADKTDINDNACYLFSRLISTPGKEENNYTRSIHASVSYDGRYWSEESTISIQVLPTAQTPHTHLWSEYYDSNLVRHEYCVFCEPRTDDQLLEDSQNFARYIKNYAAQLAAENIFSIDDPTSELLRLMRESNASLIKQIAQLAYNLASFSWSDAVKQFIPGSEAVDKVKKNCVQSAISRILNNQTMQQSKLDTTGIEIAQEIASELDDLIDTLKGIASENVLRELQTARALVEKGIQSNNCSTVVLGFMTADDAWGKIRKYNLDITEPNFISFKNQFDPGILDYISLAVDVAIDWYTYAQWNDAQIELLTLCLSDARKNVALLEEIKSTYSDDDTVTSYCNEMIRNINNYVSNELWGSVCKAADTARELTKILLENTMESAFNLAVDAGVNTLLKKLCGMKGGFVGIAGAGAGLLAELIAGTDTTAKNMDNVAIIYTDIESFVNKYYGVVHNSNSKSDECKAFGMIYVGDMKMAAVSWVGEIRKNEQKENCDKINASLERQIQSIIEGID